MLNILLLSADTPEQLRSCDVDRVLLEASEQNVFNEFKTWLLAQNLKETTRKEVESLTEEDLL